MSARLLKYLGVVALLLAVAWGFYLHSQVPQSAMPFAKSADQAVVLSLQQGDATAQLKKEGSNWRVGEANGRSYPADQERVKALLSSLKEFRVEDMISDRADRAMEFHVTQASGTWVRFLAASNQVLAEGMFGQQAPDDQHVYFKYMDSPRIYLARGVIVSDFGAALVREWRSRTLFELPEASVTAVTVQGKGFKTALLRSSDTWTMNGKRIESGPANSLVGALAHIRVQEYADVAQHPELAYDRLNAASVHVESATSRVDIRFGPLDAQRHAYPMSIGNELGTAWIGEAAGNAILLNPSAFKPN